MSGITHLEALKEKLEKLEKQKEELVNNQVTIILNNIISFNDGDEYEGISTEDAIKLLNENGFTDLVANYLAIEEDIARLDIKGIEQRIDNIENAKDKSYEEIINLLNEEIGEEQVQDFIIMGLMQRFSQFINNHKMLESSMVNPVEKILSLQFIIEQNILELELVGATRNNQDLVEIYKDTLEILANVDCGSPVLPPVIKRL